MEWSVESGNKGGVQGEVEWSGMEWTGSHDYSTLRN